MNNFLIYKASAGSGKTFLLVKSFLKLVLQNPYNFRHILAITFTNKATAEMKSRIISSLAEIANGEKTHLYQQLQNELPENTPLESRAAKAQKLILHNYSHFAVSTIDSFFQRIIRSFARELGLNLSYDIEFRQDHILSLITSELIDEAGIDKELTSWLEQFIMEKVDEKNSWYIEAEISSLGKTIFSDVFSLGESTRESTGSLLRSLKSIVTSFESEMALLGQKALDHIHSHQLDISDFTAGQRGPASYFLKLINKANFEPNDTLLKVYNGEKSWYSRTSPKIADIQSCTEGGLDQILIEILEYYDQNYKAYFSAVEVLKQLYAYGILKDLQLKLKNYRIENDVLLISDTNKLLKQVTSHTDTPFIYEKTGSRYHNLLIDEFQDTSSFQWDNLLPLARNSLASGHFVMVVGDVKQSVYRWRGGNMKLLLTQITEDLQSFMEPDTLQTLQTNWRSRKTLVDFNNHIFSHIPQTINILPHIKDKKILPAAWEPSEIKQEYSPAKPGTAFIKILFSQNEKGDAPNSNKWKEDSLLQMIDFIEKAVENGAGYGDIAVLTRSNNEGVLAARHLMDHNFSVISQESLLLEQSPVINFLVNAIKFLLNSEDTYTLLKASLFLFSQKNEKDQIELHDFLLNKNRDLFSSKDSKLQFFLRLPLYEMIERLIMHFEIEKYCDIYTDTFKDIVLEFTEHSGSNPADFIRYWDEEGGKKSVVMPEGNDAIRVMTIHKSKGLQFPIVCVPFINMDTRPNHKDTLWVSSDENPYQNAGTLAVKAVKGLEKTIFDHAYYEECLHVALDNLNLLYVAFTRAEDQLFAFFKQSKREEHFSCIVYENLPETGLFKENVNNLEIYTYGEPVQYDLKDKKMLIEEKVQYKKSIPWQNRLAISTRSAALFHDNENLRYGRLIHHILSGIQTLDDIESVCNKMLIEGHINREELKKMKNILVDFPFNLTEVKDWFSGDWQIRNEAAILTENAKTIRPDRVMIRDNEAIVLDYKSGIPATSDRKQVSHYVDLLREMGYGNVKGYVLYLVERELVEI